MKVGFQLGIIIVMMGLIYFHVRGGNTGSSCVTWEEGIDGNCISFYETCNSWVSAAQYSLVTIHRLCLSSSRRYRTPRRCRPLHDHLYLTSTIGSQYLVSFSLISNSRRQLRRGSLWAHHIFWPGRKIYGLMRWL